MKKSVLSWRIDHTKEEIIFIDEDTLTKEELMNIAEEDLTDGTAEE